MKSTPIGFLMAAGNIGGAGPVFSTPAGGSAPPHANLPGGNHPPAARSRATRRSPGGGTNPGIPRADK